MSGYASDHEKSCKSRWAIHSPTTISYFPSKSKRDSLGSEIKLEIGGKICFFFKLFISSLIFRSNFKELSHGYKQSVLNSLLHENYMMPEPANFLAEAVEYAVKLLFSISSLSAIHRLFIDERGVINQDEIDADDLFDAFSFLKDQLKFKEKSKSLLFRYMDDSFVKYG
jgi:hypothetical protein